MRKLILSLAFSTSLTTGAFGKTWIIVLPTDYAGSKETLTSVVGDAVLPLQLKDHVLVYSALTLPPGLPSF